MDAARPLGLVVFVGLMAAAMALGGPFGIFVDVSSVLLVGLGSLAAWNLVSGRQISELRAALATEQPTSEALARALVTARGGRRAHWLVAGLAMGVGVIQMLQAIDDPAAIGPALAVTLISFLYALGLDLFGYSRLEHRVVQKAAALGVADDVMRQAGDSADTARTRGRHRERARART